jgi:iron complex outermembrane receptor protein
MVSAELGLDLVRGSLNNSGTPLPRILVSGFEAGFVIDATRCRLEQAIVAAKQDRVSGNETPTDGYTLLRLYSSYSFARGTVLHTITARLDNATNELYRNHLSLIKDVVPELGRNFKLVYGVRF